MMAQSMNKLINISSAAISLAEPVLDIDARDLAGHLANELLGMLKEKNGFYAFESALHVLPTISLQDQYGIKDWNAPEQWKFAYQGMANDCLFFAEDVFGGQFCIKNDKVYMFDSETAGLEYCANNLDDWAEAILSNYDVLTGYSLAHKWQLIHGSLPPGKRLVPKVPFTTGGAYSIENLYLLDSLKAMKLRGELAVQIKNVPEGSKIKFKIEE